MKKPEHMVNYVYLGYSLHRWHYPVYSTYKDVAEGVQTLISFTEQLGFPRAETELHSFLDDLREAYEQDPEAFMDRTLYGSNERLPSHFLTRISEILSRVHGQLKDMSNCEVLTIDRSAVSNALRNLHDHAVDEHQRVLVDEAILCLECGAYRSAIVMGWNLTLDHIRQWVFSSPQKRLKALNAVLAPNPISHYEDFFLIPERVLIDKAHEAKLFPKNTQKLLVGALDTRNSFAHPSRIVATPASAAGYIDSLIKNVITNPHFAFKRKPTR
jgi:hypothetical protein